MRWNRKNIGNILFEECCDLDLQDMMMDGTSIRAHAAVDALGNPLRLMITAGQCNEITQAYHLTQGFQQSCLIADKAYDKEAFIKEVESQGNTVVIPPQKNRKHQRYYELDIYKERNLIDCFFGKLKQLRRIFSRFDQCADTFLSFIHCVSTLIWLH